MSALTLGLIAALMWGFHDICVRFVSQKVPLMASLMTVLFVGTAFHLTLMLAQGSFAALPAPVVGVSALSGVFFLVASLGLYGAFQRGPVRLVAPIIASFPILSVGWAALGGAQISLVQWGAVALIIIGVSTVAALADDSAGDNTLEAVPKGRTILYASIAALGFAGTFALGQMASAAAGEMPVTLVTRLVAIGLLCAGMLAFRLPFWPGVQALPILALMGLADGIALLCVMTAGHLADAQYAAVASSTFGLLTIVLAWAFLKERMSALQWLGCAAAFCGIGYLAL
ncbi:DMT family transporter [Planktotalea arctica]|uniref:DMT family transporter n=1 Tax=Planktotalea arctica TaxID=1481893 RepID=UPI000A172E92|nr:DMT family transporter [Planktotalea arctica]